MVVKMTRRDAMKISATLVAGTGLSGCLAEPKVETKSIETVEFAPLPKPKAKRVVVVGGGWSGLSLAKELKLLSPTTDVVLVEPRFEFVSCPMSNLWLVGNIELEFLTHDYLQGARNHNYTYFNATATGVDKDKSILFTTNGAIKYDHLVFATGIDYDYSFWTDDVELERRLRQEYPPAFKPGSEHITLRNKIQNFKGGTFIFTVPAGNYRCLPAPYERTCMVADYFKQKGIDAKIILLDENNDITIKEEGFHSAFKDLYKDIVTYIPNSKIENIDLDKKIVETEFDEFSFDDASFYPHVRGSKILEVCGIAKNTPYNRLEGDIDPVTYEVNGYSNIYISGDARPMGFSKSGNTSNTEAKYVANLIATKIENKPNIKWQSPVTVCISLVAIKPERGIFIHSEYAYYKDKKAFGFATPVTNEVWQGKMGLDNAQYAYDWANSMYVDMFGNV